MRLQEDFLHYIWKYQKFETAQLVTSEGIPIQVIHPGHHNHQAGPDFFNAQLCIENTQWAGTVEIHIKSSDWYQHQHEVDEAYDTVILHVVWEHDVEVFRKDNTPIPTLILASLVTPKLLKSYDGLFTEERRWIPCEQELPKVEDFYWEHWLERLFFERLEEKAALIEEQLKLQHHHWEAVLFELLCKNFGLNLNGVSFLSLAKSISFPVLQKCANTALELEALFFGQMGLLSIASEDPYVSELATVYKYQKHKFKFSSEGVISPTFFRLRPANFPTLRLAQLADLYARRKTLFSDLMTCATPSEAITILTATASSYWDTHYQFGTTSKAYRKTTSKAFISLLMINTVAPMQWCYKKHFGKEADQSLLHFFQQLPPEKNSVVQKFNTLRPKATNAMKSQALLHLKSKYCDRKRCLECAVGNVLITA
ncbi:MAG: hypothetical protein CMC35_09300 [Flavobacteriaceae bacterium]|nr:hypothetical protein [Flavobacteriaceae bacterium]|tara:strand:+ start:43277 stop:44554 length:1278 start_codon:yes stop_codon:yes gene_type:complete